MRIIIAMVVLSAACFLLGCATTSSKSAGIAKEIPQTIEQACNFYTTTKPQVVAYRDWAVKNWDAKVPGTDQPLIPDTQKALLLNLDAHLKELDALGVDVCALDGVLKATAAGSTNGGGVRAAIQNALGNVTIDEVLSGVLKVAATYTQLKAQGAF